jgi:hypothetical protein
MREPIRRRSQRKCLGERGYAFAKNFVGAAALGFASCRPVLACRCAAVREMRRALHENGLAALNEPSWRDKLSRQHVSSVEQSLAIREEAHLDA